jgi:hypothetical protein
MPNSTRLLFILVPVLALAAFREFRTPIVTVPNFSGHWEHAAAHFLPTDKGPGPVVNMPGLSFLAMNVWIGDYRNPILQPWASEAVRVHAVAGLERGEPLLSQLQLCMPFGVPNILTLREPVQLLQEPGMVTILYQHDNQIRRVFLNEGHPSNLEPSPYGHSVGHYEGDTLVVDTRNMSNTGAIDFYGTPHSAALHVSERYRLLDAGRVLQVDFTVSDLNTFTSEWHAAQRYYSIPLPRGLRENICAENIRMGVGSEYPVPTDDMLDF